MRGNVRLDGIVTNYYQTMAQTPRRSDSTCSTVCTKVSGIHHDWPQSSQGLLHIIVLSNSFASWTQCIGRRQSRPRCRTQSRKRARRVQIAPHIPEHVDSPPALRRLHFDALEQRLNGIEREVCVLAVAERRRLLQLHLQYNRVAGDEVLRLIPADKLGM